MSFPCYPAYKDSGVEWLGKVPKHWCLARIKASVSSCRNGIWGNEPLGDRNDIPCIRVADFDRQRMRVCIDEPTVRNVTERDRESRTLRMGDLLLEKSGGGEKQPVGFVVLYDHNDAAVCSNFIARIELAEEMHPSYWCYLHATAYSLRLTTRSINQTSGIQNLDQDRYFNEYSVFPPFSEQATIANFLDHETAKIDALIAEQEKLIELLKEKRQAVISHAVTKGLDPNVKMKDSGVEWLGQVPEHWAVASIGYFAQVDSGATPNRETPAFWGGDIPWVKTGEINYNEIVETDEYITEEGLLGSSARLAPPGTLLMAMYGQGVTRGRVAILRIAAAYNQACAAMQFSDILDVRFCFYYFISAYEFFRDNGNETSQMNLSTGVIRKFKLTVPPASEQREIIKKLDAEVLKFDSLLIEAKHSIALLQERRSALISAAVTGQIDVCNFA